MGALYQCSDLRGTSLMPSVGRGHGYMPRWRPSRRRGDIVGAIHLPSSLLRGAGSASGMRVDARVGPATCLCDLCVDAPPP